MTINQFNNKCKICHKEYDHIHFQCTTHDGKNICDSCFDEKYIICSRCGNIKEIENSLYNLDDEWKCNNCFTCEEKSQYVASRCSFCSENLGLLYSNDYEGIIFSDCDLYLCEECGDKHMKKCDICGIWDIKGNLKEVNGFLKCKVCISNN